MPKYMGEKWPIAVVLAMAIDLLPERESIDAGSGMFDDNSANVARLYN